MTLLILAFLAGVLTILSPCILPVLPFVFAGAGRRFTRTGLPLLLGMAGAFTAVATLAAVGGGWALAANQYGRLAALALFALFAATLLSDRLAEWLSRPLVALGRRLTPVGPSDDEGAGPFASALLGVATGLLWAPCAGPILGLVLTGAALNGASVTTTLLILAYALGAATSLALALRAGARVSLALKRAIGPSEWLRRALGAAVLAGVVAIGFGWDAQLLSRFDFANTTSFEERLLDWTGARKAAASDRATPANIVSPASGAGDWRNLAAMQQERAPLLIDVAFSETPSEPRTPQPDITRVAATGADLPVEGVLPGFAGATEWLNSPPLTAQALRGKTVLVVFWTFNCYNCLNTLPHIRAWAEKYRDHGLVVVGVHTPELPFERDVGNVRNAVARLKIGYPVAIDNGYAVWKAFGNEYWPAAYFVDAEGRIRHHHFGEHDYENSERVIQQLLREAGNRDVPGGFVTASGSP